MQDKNKSYLRLTSVAPDSPGFPTSRKLSHLKHDFFSRSAITYSLTNVKLFI